ncbi:unnamed protein product [Clonostachys solani]|uniref:Uncharacterized protein n=1 Tax=Clonostachys solani TaxID=160281 RepID=A0A9N9YZL5_9HYPO|nr:unnamed protein product [Clonostachys solani]
MPCLAVPLPFPEARHKTRYIRGATQHRHQVPPPELLQIHADLMARLCYMHPSLSIEDRDVNKAVMMSMIHDLDQVIANKKDWGEREIIAYLETRLKSTNPALAQALFNLWKEYGANETCLAKFSREIADLARFHRAFTHEKRAQRIFPFPYIERLRLAIDSEWFQVMADSILKARIVVKEIHNSGPIFFVFGGPGSGKTFVCEQMAAAHGFKHISLAALIEEEAHSPSSAHRSFINTSRSQGSSMPMSFSISLLKHKIRRMYGPGILIDGFPETLGELREFEQQV